MAPTGYRSTGYVEKPSMELLAAARLDPVDAFSETFGPAGHARP